MALKSVGLEAKITPMPDMAAVNKREMPTAWPRLKKTVLCQPCCSDKTMAKMTPMPGDKIFAREVIKNKENKEDISARRPTKSYLKTMLRSFLL